jgi:2',3'-cyclic-nucleotide 2'-phosphodiesterase/3'-nucleotidase/5'-nucleotidase
LKKTAFYLCLLLCFTIGIFSTKATLIKVQSPDPVVVDADNKIVIEVVTINDFHGSLIKNGKNVGVANLVSAIKAQKAANPNTIFVAAGDLFQGSAESNLLYGQPVAACLKEAGLVASAIGNHEYDWGNNRFASWEKEGGFSFLAANIYDRNTKKLVTYAKPYLIVNVSGIKIALIGLTTPETAYKTTPANVETIEFKNPVTVLPQYIKEARSQGANLVVALTHLGAFQDKSGVISGEAAELAQVAGLDGIIAGHTHEIIAGKVGSIPLVMAYYNGRSLGKLTFTIEKNSAKLISAQASLDHLYLHQDTLHEDEATKTILNKFLAQVQPILSETIGETKVDINHNNVNIGPTLMGEWVCQVIQQKTQTQIAIYNGGGLRESLPQGKITIGNLYTLLPFDNTLVTAKLTGAQVKETIENGLANPSLNYFGQTAGLYVVYDLTKPFGQRVVKITLANGVPLQMTKYYTVVANDFMFSGGDQYTMLTKAKDIKDTGIPIRDVLIDYIKAQKVIEPVYKGYQAPATESATVIKPAA